VQALDLVGKLLRNVIENPQEERYRSFKRDNPTIRERLTRYREGGELISLLGFQEGREEASVSTMTGGSAGAAGDVVYRVNGQVSTSFLKVRAG
jgi:hypothetical protein